MNLKKFVEIVKEKGGTCMLIGGAVISIFKNLEIKDYDIEVYGLSYNRLSSVLKELNLPCNMVGQSFGIIKTEIGGMDIDLSIPRVENKIGVGHTGFSVECNANLTPKQAGLRRDLTINSMYFNMHTKKIVDPFNGLKDLKEGRIKATNKKTFVQDPLRVLRIMQLLPRKGKFVDKRTIKLCKSMVNSFDELPKERVFEEFNKLLLKAKKPSMGLNFLKESNWIKHFPELSDLIGCPQNLNY